MSHYSKIADEVKVLAKRFQGILELSKALEEIGTVENAAKEALMLKDKARVELDKAKAELVSAQNALESKKEEVKAAELKVGDVLDLAHKKAQVIIEAAKEKAAEVEVAIEKRKSLFDEKFVAAGRELSGLDVELSSKKFELEALKKEVESVKSKFSALLK